MAACCPPDLRGDRSTATSLHTGIPRPWNSPSSRCAHMTLDNNTSPAPPSPTPAHSSLLEASEGHSFPFRGQESARASTSVVCFALCSEVAARPEPRRQEPHLTSSAHVLEPWTVGCEPCTASGPGGVYRAAGRSGEPARSGLRPQLCCWPTLRPRASHFTSLSFQLPHRKDGGRTRTFLPGCGIY